MSVCQLAFNLANSYTVDASTSATADGAIVSIASNPNLNEDYHFYEGGGSYTNVDEGFANPWTIADGQAAVASIPNGENSDLLRQALTLASQSSIEWEAYFSALSQSFTINLYDSGLVLIASYLVWDGSAEGSTQMGIRSGQVAVDESIALDTAYIGYKFSNNSGGVVTGDYLNYVKVYEVVKYNLNADFDYTSGGQTNGSFGSLLPGIYTIYARSSLTCLATYVGTIGAEENYSTKYRIVFKPVINITLKVFKLEILELGYAGAIIDIEKYGDSPIIHQWENSGGQDPFASIISSFIEVTIISETDQEWIEFYTYDERQYKAKLYYESSNAAFPYGNTNIIFQGFLIPMIYSEPYNTNFNYPVKLVFTDQLKNLTQIDFSDDYENFPKGRIKIIEALKFCLNKTGLDLLLYDGIPILADGMADLSILSQLFIDTKTYLKDDGEAQSCDYVLRAILESLGSRIYQSGGIWYVDQVTQKAASTVSYFPFSFSENIAYQATTQTPRVQIRKVNSAFNTIDETPTAQVVFSEQSANLQIAENYGEVEVIYDIQIESENNLLDYANFEAVDLPNGQFVDWQLTTSGFGINFGTEEFEPNKKALFVDFDLSQLVSSANILHKVIPYVWPGEDNTLKLSFDIYTRPLYTGVYISLDFALRLNDGVDNYYLQPTNYSDTTGRWMGTGTDDLIGGAYNRLFITDHLTWKTITVEIDLNTEYLGAGISGDLELYFNFNSNSSYDYASIALLKSVVTDDNPDLAFYNNKARVLFPSGGFLTSSIGNYELERISGAVEDSPDLILPNDYATADYQYVWVLKKTTPFPSFNEGTEAAYSLLQSVLIRNVKIGFVPESGVEEKITETEIINTKIKNNLSKTVLHGDISGLAENYRFLTPSYFSNAAGDPVTGFYRRGVSESFTSQKLLGKIIRGQYVDPRYLLTGSFDTRVTVPMFHNTFYELRTGKIYLPLSLNLDYRNMVANAEILEVLVGDPVVDDGIDPPDPEIEPPVATYEHSDEFADEFS